MAYIQMLMCVVVGFLLGLVTVYIWWKRQSPVGDLLIWQGDEEQINYMLQLENDLEELHSSRYIFFKVKKSQ